MRRSKSAGKKRREGAPASGSAKDFLLVGVTGGIGSGKSEVLRYLSEAYGAECIQLDAAGRQLLEIGGACYGGARELFGEEAVREDGSLDRGVIARMMFADPEKKRALESMIHPAVKKEALRFAEECRARAAARRERAEVAAEPEQGDGTSAVPSLCVIEAALLIEDHYDEICDELWYIYADESVRAERLRETRGYTDERIAQSFAAQLTDAEFRARAAFVIDNSGDFEETRRQIDAYLKEKSHK